MRNSPMTIKSKRIFFAAVTAVTLTLGVVAASSPAEAQRFGGRGFGGRGFGGGGFGRGFGYRGFGGGFGPGFALGALAGGYGYGYGYGYPSYGYGYGYPAYDYGYPAYGPAYAPAYYGGRCTIQRRPVYSKYRRGKVIGYRRSRICG
jgi:hypothetical protein